MLTTLCVIVRKAPLSQKKSQCAIKLLILVHGLLVLITFFSMDHRRLDLHFLFNVRVLFSYPDENMPLKPKKEWVHMNVLEPEKLEWMKDLPTPRKKGTKKVSGQFENKVMSLCNTRFLFLVFFSCIQAWWSKLNWDKPAPFVFFLFCRPCRLGSTLQEPWFHQARICPPTLACTIMEKNLRLVGNPSERSSWANFNLKDPDYNSVSSIVTSQRDDDQIRLLLHTRLK